MLFFLFSYLCLPLFELLLLALDLLTHQMNRSCVLQAKNSPSWLRKLNCNVEVLELLSLRLKGTSGLMVLYVPVSKRHSVMEIGCSGRRPLRRLSYTIKLLLQTMQKVGSSKGARFSTSRRNSVMGIGRHGTKLLCKNTCATRLRPG